MLPPIIMVGNKCDLEVERMVTTAEGKKTADNLQCSFFETTGICIYSSYTNIKLIF